MNKPRGIRNNNPLNIRWNGSTNWRGMTGADNNGFVVFDTPENGIRAATRILKSYANRGIFTLESIISAWAPSTENNTKAYIQHAASELKINRFDRVNEEQYAQLIEVMIKHENGTQPYSSDTIESGIMAA